MANNPVGRYYRKAYQDFSGRLNNQEDPLRIKSNQFAQIDNFLTNDTGVLEKVLGYSVDGSPFAAVTTAFIRMLVNYKRGSSVDELVCAALDVGNTNATYKVDLKNSSGDGNYAYIGHTAGTNASFTSANTAVTGVGTAWLSHLKAGDKIKASAHADSAYTEIASVTNDTTLVLVGGGYLGATAATVAYTARIILHKDFVPVATTFNNKLIITNGSEVPMTFDNTTLNKITDGDAPKGKFIEIHKNRVFVASTSGAPSTIFWSAVNDEATWDAASLEPVFPQDNGNICAIKSFADSLIVLKDNGKIYQCVGNLDQTAVGDIDYIRKVDFPDSIGGIAGYTVVVHTDGLLYFLAETGLYTLDRAMRLNKVSWPIEGTVPGIVLKSTITSAKSYLYDTSTQWDTGSHNGTIARSSDAKLRPYFDVTTITDAYKTPGGCSVYIDSSKNVHIAYINMNDRTKVNYKKWSASDNGYSIEESVSFGHTIYGVSLDVSSGGIAGVAVSTFDETATGSGLYTKGIYFSQRTAGAWITAEQANTSGGGVFSITSIYGVSLRFRSDGLARIACVAATNANNVGYLRQAGAGSWNTVVTAGDGDRHIHCSLYLNGDSDPRIAASDFGVNTNYLYSGAGVETSISSIDSVTLTYANNDYAVQLDKTSGGVYKTLYCDNGTLKARNHGAGSTATIDSDTDCVFNGYSIDASDANNAYYTLKPSSNRVEKYTFEGSATLINTDVNTDTVVPGDRGMHRNGTVFATVMFGANSNELIVRRLAYRGVWTGPETSDSTLSAWGTYAIRDQLTNSATVTHQVALATSSPATSYATITDGQVVSTDTTLVFVIPKITFVLGAFSGPEIDSITLNYTGTGIDAKLPTAISFDNELYMSFTENGQTNNNRLLHMDMMNTFAIHNHPATHMCRYKRLLYAGSPTVGKVYKLLNSTNFNSSAITATAVFKEDLLGSLELEKEVYKVYVIYQVKPIGTFNFSYRLNNFKTYGGSAWTTTSVDQTDIGIAEVLVGNKCNSIQFKIESSDLDATIGIVGFVVLYEYLNLR